MTAPAPLDLGKPMRWKLDHTPVRVLWSDDSDVFAEWQPDDDAPVRQHMRTEWFTERAENIPPEPVAAAVGPEEVWVSFRKESHIYGELWSAHKSREYAPSVATAVVRYLRADLAARQVGPTLHECSDCNKLITERDHAEQMADKLADHIADLCDIEIGEHSSGNCPWSNALEAKTVARKVRRLTSDERQKLHEADTWCDLDSAFIAIMAARGIEVGE